MISQKELHILGRYVAIKKLKILSTTCYYRDNLVSLLYD